MKEVETFLLKPKKIRSDESAKVTRLLIKWSFDQRFGFSMTEYELRKSFLRIEFESDEKVVGEISINMYYISTGPYHQDYAVKLKKGDNTRVSFDMKVSQVIEIRLDSILTEVNLAIKHPGEKFNYSIKTIVTPPSLRSATTLPSTSAPRATRCRSCSMTSRRPSSMSCTLWGLRAKSTRGSSVAIA